MTSLSADDDALSQFPPEAPRYRSAVGPLPDLVRASLDTESPTTRTASSRRALAQRTSWARAFWLGCAAGAVAVAWLISGESDVTTPARAEAVAPTPHRPTTSEHPAARDLAAARDLPVARDPAAAPRPAQLQEPELVAGITLPAMASVTPVATSVRGTLAPTPAARAASRRPVPPAGASQEAPKATTPARSPAAASARRFEGSLAVESTPSRAQVFINGEPAGLTPMVMTGMPVGSRAIRVEADEHEPWWSVVQVVAGQETSVRATLPPAAAPAPFAPAP